MNTRRTTERKMRTCTMFGIVNRTTGECITVWKRRGPMRPDFMFRIARVRVTELPAKRKGRK
jgi:hypothetical protein